ncbi:MAG: bis(5'-nucleosyl)-tetraphosphatase (symmetrical) YqeK [Cyanobacteria bacterium P01_A01_bin.135]
MPAARPQIVDWLTATLPAPRLAHVLRVEQTSVELAHRHGLDVGKAALAGLLHDTAKYFSPERLLALAEANHLPLDEVLRDNPRLLHADVGAIVAREKFGVRDPQVLQAIANHTLGRPAMDGLSCAVFLADGLEPGRGNTPELEKLRQVSQHDLHSAVWLACDRTLRHLLDNNRFIHLRAIATRNWFLKSAKTSGPSRQPSVQCS